MSNQITPNPSVPSQVVQEVKFPKFVNNLGIIPTSYKDSMSYYECLAWLCKYLEETVIPTVNENGEATHELQNLYVQLNSYVTHYFENLDVQDEINNKLDQLVESGELQTIVNEYFSYITQRQIDFEEQISQEQTTFENQINNKIGDETKLTSLNKSSIVRAINTNNNLQELFLGNGIVYDIPDDLNHVQGSCIHNNILYVAVQGQTNYGTIYMFNILSNIYIGKYENVLMYHGNDLTYINDKIYIASYDSLKICIYDPSNNTSTEINPFSDLSSGFTHLTGVEKYDDNNIICWVEANNPINTIIFDKMLKLNINSLSYSDIGLNDPYNLTSYNDTSVTRQNIAISDNDIYILMISPCIIYHGYFDYDEEHQTDIIVIDKIFNLPSKDNHNNPVGEMESLATINSINYPTGSLMITSRLFNTFKNTNNFYGEDTIAEYIISPKTSNVQYANISLGYFIKGTNSFGYTSVGKTSTNNSLLELGSIAYPFKDLMRGINSVIGSYGPSVIQIVDSSTYYLPYLFGIKNLEIQVGNNCNPIIYIGDIENCDITFLTTGSGTITFRSLTPSSYRSSIFASSLNFYGAGANSIIFNELQLLVSECSTLKFRRTKFLNTNHVSSGYAIDISDTSYVMANFSSFEINESDKLIRYGGGSVLATDIASTNITKGGVGLLLQLTNV